MKLTRHPSGGWRSRPGNGAARRLGESGFTMIEIALCLAVIGFALVAIIGILPTGMQVQKENREDTLINQDGTYLMEAIRNGAQGLDDLVNYVDTISINGKTNYAGTDFKTSQDIIGLLSTPDANVRAVIRCISGSAAEKANTADMKDFAFRYELKVEISPFGTSSDRNSENLSSLSNRLHEVRLQFRWPVLRAGTGRGHQVYRALVSGGLAQTTNNNQTYYYFRQ